MNYQKLKEVKMGLVQQVNKMEIKLRNTYSITEPKEFLTSFDFDVENYLKDKNISDKDDLRYTLEDIVWEDNSHYQYYAKGDEDKENDDVEVFIENLDELVEQYSYLIVPPLEPTCCDDAPFGSTYCNTCGKKLK